MQTLQEMMVAEISKRAAARAKATVGAGVSAQALDRTDPLPAIVPDDERPEKLANAVEYINAHFDELFPISGTTPVRTPVRSFVEGLREKTASVAPKEDSTASVRDYIERKLGELRTDVPVDQGGGPSVLGMAKTAASKIDKKRLLALIEERRAAARRG